MKRSVGRVFTTHVGRLSGPNERAAGAPSALTSDELRAATADVIRKQADAGIDVVSDGELARTGYGYSYYSPRIAGIATRPTKPGEPSAMPQYTNERIEFKDFYFEVVDRGRPPAQERMICDAPLSFTGQELLRGEIANFQSALKEAGVPYEDAFMCVISPGWLEHFVYNEYYGTTEEFLYAVGDVLGQSYKAIVDAGFLLQVDDPALATKYDMLVPSPSIEEYRKIAALRVEVLNHALAGLPEDRVRYHLCFGSWHGPHTHDLGLRDVVDLMLRVTAGAYSVEAGNPRHEVDWKVWKDVRLPEGKILIPGVVSHASNVVEHPELVADRIEAFASLVGRDNVIAGTDCGMGGRVHAQIAWAKLQALAEGAALASKTLWS